MRHSSKWLDVKHGTVAFAPCAFSDIWKIKQWGGYVDLAEYFESVVLFGSSSDILPDDSNYHGGVTDYIGKTGIADALSIISQCSMFIGNDCGLAHASAAMGVPTFIIFGPTSDVKNLPQGAHCIKGNLDCQPCQGTDKFMKCDDLKCMKELTADEVYKQIKGAE